MRLIRLSACHSYVILEKGKNRKLNRDIPYHIEIIDKCNIFLDYEDRMKHPFVRRCFFLNGNARPVIIKQKLRGKGENKMDTSLFHELEGEYIYFKPLSTSDAQEIHSYASDKNVKRYIGWPLMKTLDETRNYIVEMLRRESAGTHLYASIVLKSTKIIIGTAMIFNFDHEAKHAEIGYVFDSRYWGKGYGTETVALMNGFAFDSLNLHKLHARVVGANIGSIRVLEKNGFMLEGRLKDYHFIDNSYSDGMIFGKY